MNEKMGERLLKLRMEHGLSQEDLASALGVSRQAVSKWERGEASLDTDNLIKLAEFYHISIDELLNHKVEKEEKKVDEKKDDKVHIEWDGIHVESKDGDKVHVDFHGVHVLDKDGVKVDVSKKGVYVDDQKKETFSKCKRVVAVIDALYSLFVVVAYIVVGACFNIWHPTWLIFLTIPLISSLVEAITKKKYDAFAYPVLVVFIYLLFGFLNNLGYLHMANGWWHPGWVIFLTIPLYYTIGSSIRKVKEAK